MRAELTRNESWLQSPVTQSFYAVKSTSFSSFPANACHDWGNMSPLKSCLYHMFHFAGMPHFRKCNVLQYFTYVLLLSLLTLRSYVLLMRNGQNWISFICILNNAFRSWIFTPSLSMQKSVTSCHPTSKLNCCTDLPLVLI